MKPLVISGAYWLAQATSGDPTIDAVSKYGLPGVAAVLLYFFLREQRMSNRRIVNLLMRVAQKQGVDVSESDEDVNKE